MRIVTYRSSTSPNGGIALRMGKDLVAVDPSRVQLPETVEGILELGQAAIEALGKLVGRGKLLDEDRIDFLPTLRRPGKVICVGLNYADHVAESPYPTPTYPTVFPRYATSLVGHKAPIIRPQCSEQLDYEGELIAVVGKRGRHIPKEKALEWIAGYACFNEASIRDYQFKTPQWAVGKNFDDTGAFGPELVTSDELPAGASGLKIETRLNGQTVQSSNTKYLLFDVATIISTLSEAFTFEPGDLIATGTPEGVGLFRKPPLFMKHGDLVEVEIEGIGVLKNPVRDEHLQ